MQIKNQWGGRASVFQGAPRRGRPSALRSSSATPH